MPTDKEIRANEESFQISSNLTLLLKIALPVFWAVFFGAFTATALIKDMHLAFGVSRPVFKSAVVLFYTSGILLLYFTLWQLKRVEFLRDKFYATNYFKHYVFGYGLIQSLKILDFGIAKVLIIRLNKKSAFGRKIPVLLSRKRLKLFAQAYPETAQEIGVTGLKL